MKTAVQKKNNSFAKALKNAFIILLCFLTFFSIFFTLYLIYLNSKLTLDEIALRQINTELNIFDLHNNKLSSSLNQNNNVRLENLPSYVYGAFISIEDKEFFNHKGLNYKRIVGAIINNIKSHNFNQGASTISQQLIKNTHLSNEKTISRKLKEILLTKKMENKLSKNEILETYLNAIYFGNGAYGLEQASKIYFNKSAKDLTISESACLAGIIKSPKLYSPIFNLENSIKRRNIVLKEMKKDNIISNEQYEKALKEQLIISNETRNNKNYYENAVIEETCEILGISEKELAIKNYYIFTYLDADIQSCLTDAINNKDYYHINSFGNIADSAGIVIDNNTGGVLAFAGKSDYDIVNMHRSPGSSIKPILVYAPALESGIISPISQILDEQTKFDNYSPHNVGNKYYGYISATESVEKSLNIPAIKIMQAQGIESCKDMAKKCGIKFDNNDKNYALALGGMTKGTTVKELVNSYIPFSNKGNFIKAQFIRKICDKNGNVIYSNKSEKNRVMSEETAYLMTEMLESGVQKGTSSRLNTIDFDLAGKTGTVGIKGTNNNSDVWSVAYTTDLTFGIWLGNSTGKTEYMLEGANNGGTYCSSMLKQTIIDTYKFREKPKKFEIPQNIIEVKLDSIALENDHSLMLADENTPEMFTIKARFNKKYAPKLWANSFSELKAIEIDVKMNDNNAIIMFSAQPQVEYKVVRINDDETKVLKVIKNQKGKVEVIDNQLEKDSLYTYYVEAVAKNHATKIDSKRVRSNSVKVITN